MKRILQITMIAVMAITLASCGKTEKILVKNDGLWNIDRTTTTTEIPSFPTTTDTEENTGTLEFTDAGTGIITYNDGTTDTFDWEVNEDGDKITITYSAGDPLTFDILESDKDHQEWENVTIIEILGITTTYTTNVQLSSK